LAKFIVVEGLDGSGTTTQVKALFDLITERNKNITKITKEPYQGHISDLIRNVLAGKEEYQKYRESLTWLYMADRDYHIRDFIRPTLESGIDVISDRYIPSTMAYQSENNNLTLYSFYGLHTISDFIIPDLTVYIKVPVEVCLKRLEGRPEQEIFEKKEILEGVFERYDKTFDLLRNEGWRILELDGTEPPEIITEKIYQDYLQLLVEQIVEQL